MNYDVFSGAGAIHRTFGLGPNQSKNLQGLVNVQIKRHPTIRDIISKKYLKVMSRIPTKGHIPTPDLSHLIASTMDYDGFEHVHQALFRKLQGIPIDVNKVLRDIECTQLRVLFDQSASLLNYCHLSKS